MSDVVPTDIQHPPFAPRAEVYYPGFGVGSYDHDQFVAAGRRLVGVHVYTLRRDLLYASAEQATYALVRQGRESIGDEYAMATCIVRGLFTGRFLVRPGGPVVWEVVAFDVAYDPSFTPETP